MILDLPPTIEQVIMVNAEQQGMSPEQIYYFFVAESTSREFLSSSRNV